MRTRFFVVLAALLLVTAALPAQQPSGMTLEQAEREGVELGTPGQARITQKAAVQPRPTAKGADQLNLLLIPDSTNDRVMSFDPATGNLLNPDYVPTNNVLGTAICAILNHDGTRILVSDQIGDVVHAFDLSGAYQGIFAPAGGVNTAILDNVRGISLRPNGNLLVTVASGANSNAVAEFDTSGNYVGNFVANGAGGISSPWDAFYRPDRVMVPGSGSSNVVEYDTTGAFVQVFAPVPSFPEQITRAANGNYLVANFSGTQGIYDFQPDGTLVGVYNPAEISGYRGVYELGNGNLLVTTGSGVHEITRTSPSTLVESKITGVSSRFIELTEEPIPVELQSFSAE